MWGLGSAETAFPAWAPAWGHPLTEGTEQGGEWRVVCADLEGVSLQLLSREEIRSALWAGGRHLEIVNIYQQYLQNWEWLRLESERKPGYLSLPLTSGALWCFFPFRKMHRSTVFYSIWNTVKEQHFLHFIEICCRITSLSKHFTKLSSKVNFLCIAVGRGEGVASCKAEFDWHYLLKVFISSKNLNMLFRFKWWVDHMSWRGTVIENSL